MTEITEFALLRNFGGDIIALNDRNKVYSCGRSRNNDIICSQESISKRHCIFYHKENNLFIEDLGGLNGIYINGVLLEKNSKKILQEGDIIGLVKNEVDPLIPNKFTFRIIKQVTIDLDDEEPMKRENPEKEIKNIEHNTLCKLQKLTESETTLEARERISDESFDLNNTKIVPSVTLQESANETTICMNVQFRISRNQGSVPNIFINQLDNGLNISLEPINHIKEENAIKSEIENSDNLESSIITDEEIAIIDLCDEDTVSQLFIDSSIEDYNKKTSMKRSSSDNQSSESDIEIVEEFIQCNENNFKNNNEKEEKNFEEKVANLEKEEDKEKEFNRKETEPDKEDYSIPVRNTDFKNSGIIEQPVDYEKSEDTADLTPKKITEQLKLKEIVQTIELTPEQLDLTERILKTLVDVWNDGKKPEVLKIPKEKSILSSQDRGMESSKSKRRSSIESRSSSRSSYRKYESVSRNQNVKTSRYRSEESAGSSRCSSNAVQKLQSKFEYFFQEIIRWNPTTFGKWDSYPCIIKEDKLVKTLQFYESFENYCKIFSPLVLLDIFFEINNAYTTVEKNISFTDCKIVTESVKKVYINDEFADSLKFQIKICTPIKKNIKFPKIGDLLRLKMNINEFGRISELFAYVVHHNLKRMEDSEPKEDNAEEIYTIITKDVNINAYRSTIIELKIVTNLSHFMKLGDAMDYFKNSPLMHMIIKPNLKDYQLKFCIPVTPLVTENNLDGKQLSAMMKITEVAAKGKPKIVLVEGPPGTGKTQVLINTVLQLLQDKTKNRQGEPMKILVCATTESAIDEIVLRIYSILPTLKSRPVKMVRLGDVDQMHHNTRKFSLQEMAERYIDRSLRDYCEKESQTSREKQLTNLRNRIKEAKRLELENRLGASLALIFFEMCLHIIENDRMVTNIRLEEYKELLSRTREVILTGQNLFICTSFTTYAKEMDSAFGKTKLIPVCLVDEATLMHEIDICQVLTFGIRTLVLFGDTHTHSTKYLPSSTLGKFGMGESLFSRIKRNFLTVEDCPIIKLDCQYRMTREIAKFPDSFCYERRLKYRVKSELSITPYRIFNLKKIVDHEKIETSFAINLLLCISTYGNFKNVNKPLTIGIIVPFTTSKHRIQETINKNLNEIPKNIKIDIDTINNFHNQERDIVIASCIKREGVQLLAENHRLYSTITIARQALVLYGEFKTLPYKNTTGMWNALIGDAKHRKVFIDIDCDVEFSKLKKYMIKK